MINEELINNIVALVLQQMNENNDKKNTLYIYKEEGILKKYNDLLRSVEKYANIHYFSDIDEILTSNVNVVFLDVDQDLFVKSAIGIVDSNKLRLIADLISDHVNVVYVLDNKLIKCLGENSDELSNTVYAEYLRNYKDILESFNVSIKTPEKFISFVKSLNNDSVAMETTFQDNLLTYEKIKSYKGEKIYINKSTLVTPMARDFARDKGIKIVLID